MIKSKKGSIRIKADDAHEMLADMGIAVNGCRDFLVNVEGLEIGKANEIIAATVAIALAQEVSNSFTTKEDNNG